MALALTIRETQSNATDLIDPDVTTEAFTPSDNSILGVLVVCQNHEVGVTTSPTISGGSLTYTSRAKARNTTNYDMWAEIWTAPVGTGASMTVLVNNTTNGFGAVTVAVVDLTGYDTSTPTGVNLQALTGSRSGAYSPALSGTADANSIVLIAGVADGGTATKHASWTDIYTGSAAAGGTNHKFQMAYRAGALTTADWAALDSSFATAAVAIEIKAAGGAAAARVVGTGLTESRQLQRTRLVRASRHMDGWMARGRLIVPRGLAA